MEREVASVFHISQYFDVIINNKYQPVVEVSGCGHHKKYPNFSSFCIVYNLVLGRVRVWVLLYSAYLAYIEVRSARDKNKEKK